ncbi:hypothetical protein [Wohlfahrtiimonas populi]|uniref:hypothetical protein n=1 Tax=Wohlfahrtiimonas populi TaxID=1940240 RepID=UPI00098D2869|nr:hypothetical protein [Wohlfahrtiimonas populi]
MSNSLIPLPTNTGTIETSIQSIHEPLANFLQYNNLPTDDILAPIDERTKVIQLFESTISILGIDEKQKAIYMSKFVVCVAVGLFDGALSYLWNETIVVLRQKIAKFDINYFYSIAVSINNNYKKLNSEEDLSGVSDYDLLEVCRRMGLLNNESHRRLTNVNYFRNHGSAAHPNSTELSGLDILSFLEHCLKNAICAEFESSVVQVKRLLENIRQSDIPALDYEAICDELVKLPQERIDDFLNNIFGQYTSLTQNAVALKNIEGLIPKVWIAASDVTKYRIGAKYGYYRVNGEIEKKEQVQKFLSIVNGNNFKDEDSISQELISQLQKLRASHYGGNNFYNEAIHAQLIYKTLEQIAIPKGARFDLVKIISICFIGNGLGYREGVDENALPYYEMIIEKFTDAEIVIFCKLFDDHEFIGDLHHKKTTTRTHVLARELEKKTHNILIQNSLSEIQKCFQLNKVSNITSFKNSLNNLPTNLDV